MLKKGKVKVTIPCRDCCKQHFTKSHFYNDATLCQSSLKPLKMKCAVMFSKTIQLRVQSKKVSVTTPHTLCNGEFAPCRKTSAVYGLLTVRLLDFFRLHLCRLSCVSVRLRGILWAILILCINHLQTFL